VTGPRRLVRDTFNARAFMDDEPVDIVGALIT
jgi:hypothetical protein